MLGDGRLMKAGEKMFASLSDERIEIEDVDHIKTIIFNGKETAATINPNGDNASEEVLKTSVKADDTPSYSLGKQRSRRADSDWQSLARAGKYKYATSSAKQLGVADILKKESAATLMMLGDTARRARVFEIATKAYKVVRRRFPRTIHASGAAFALGLIAFDHRRDYRNAAKWFGMCAQFDPRGAFTREAAGRLMESLDRVGDADRARAAAEKYVARYPGGPHARLAEKLLAMH
jgi:TolA-binding protein